MNLAIVRWWHQSSFRVIKISLKGKVRPSQWLVWWALQTWEEESHPRKRWLKDSAWALQHRQVAVGKIFLWKRVCLQGRLWWQIFQRKILSLGGMSSFHNQWYYHLRKLSGIFYASQLADFTEKSADLVHPQIGESSFSFKGMGMPFTWMTKDYGRTWRSLTMSHCLEGKMKYATLNLSFLSTVVFWEQSLRGVWRAHLSSQKLIFSVTHFPTNTFTNKLPLI